jgi:hypothetical protein
LLGIEILDHLTIESVDFIPRSSIVLLTIGTQAKRSIRTVYKKAKSRFTNSSTKDPVAGEPALMVDNQILSRSDSYNMINSIKIQDIQVIFSIERPVSTETYGPNGKNGLIIIKR